MITGLKFQRLPTQGADVVAHSAQLPDGGAVLLIYPYGMPQPCAVYVPPVPGAVARPPGGDLLPGGRLHYGPPAEIVPPAPSQADLDRAVDEAGAALPDPGPHLSPAALRGRLQRAAKSIAAGKLGLDQAVIDLRAAGARQPPSYLRAELTRMTAKIAEGS